MLIKHQLVDSYQLHKVSPLKFSLIQLRPSNKLGFVRSVEMKMNIQRNSVAFVLRKSRSQFLNQVPCLGIVLNAETIMKELEKLVKFVTSQGLDLLLRRN